MAVGEAVDPVLPGGDRSEPPRVGQDERDVGAAVREVPGGADAAAAVPSTSRKYDDARRSPSGPEPLQDELGQIPAGVFHHLEEVRAGFLDRDAVDLAHRVRSHRRNLAAGFGDEPGGDRSSRCGVGRGHP